MIEDSKDRQFRGHVMGRCRVVRSPGISIYLQSHQLHFTQTERRDVIDDVEAAEKAEKSIDEFINKRARDKAAANKEEQEQQAAARRVRAKRRRENRQLWIAHHGHMHLLHTGLAAEHASKRSRLLLEAEPGESPGPEAA